MSQHGIQIPTSSGAREEGRWLEWDEVVGGRGGEGGGQNVKNKTYTIAGDARYTAPIQTISRVQQTTRTDL